MFYNNLAYSDIADTLPKATWATSDLIRGMRIRPKAEALELPYIALNTDYSTSYVTLDIDKEGAAFTYEDCGLPQPTYTVINPVNGHAHYIYRIDGYVWHKPGDDLHKKALALLNLVKKAFSHMAGADPCYVGKLSKNPLHSKWKTICGPTYTLSELAEYLPLTMTRASAETAIKAAKAKQHQAGEGRNVSLFDQVRVEAYARVKEFSSPEEFKSFVLVRCEATNTNGLPTSEIRATAKSIAKYVWNHRDRYADNYAGRPKCSAEETKERQQGAAQATSTKRRALTLDRIEAAKAKLGKEGKKVTQKAVAKLAGMSVSTVQRLLKNTSLAPPLSDNYACGGKEKETETLTPLEGTDQREVVAVIEKPDFEVVVESAVSGKIDQVEIDQAEEPAEAGKSTEGRERREDHNQAKGVGRGEPTTPATTDPREARKSETAPKSASAAEVVGALRNSGMMALDSVGTGRIYLITNSGPIYLEAATWSGILAQVQAVAELPAAVQREILLRWFDQIERPVG